MDRLRFNPGFDPIQIKIWRLLKTKGRFFEEPPLTRGVWVEQMSPPLG
jgi:hypothetical protein